MTDRKGAERLGRRDLLLGLTAAALAPAVPAWGKDVCEEKLNNICIKYGPAPRPTAPRPTAPKPAAKAETKAVLAVDAGGGGDFRSIAAAVKAAKPGARIEVRPGRYTGGVVVSKPLEIVGVGEREEIVWQTSDETLIHWKAASGRIANLTLIVIKTRGLTALSENAVWFENGSAILEFSDLTSAAWDIIVVSGSSAAPTIRNNRIHDGDSVGIFVADSGKGRIEWNEIWANAYPGVEITSGGDPVVVGNRITGNFTGVRVNDNSRGTIIDNDLRGNKRGAFDIEASAGPVVRRNNKE